MISRANAQELIRDPKFRQRVITFGRSPVPSDLHRERRHADARKIADIHAEMKDWDFLMIIRNLGKVRRLNELFEAYARKYGNNA